MVDIRCLRSLAPISWRIDFLCDVKKHITIKRQKDFMFLSVQ